MCLGRVVSSAALLSLDSVKSMMSAVPVMLKTKPNTSRTCVSVWAGRRLGVRGKSEWEWEVRTRRGQGVLEKHGRVVRGGEGERGRVKGEG